MILLIEEGLRLPGGLQGDIEYVKFTREFPEKSFVAIMDMIKSLRPKATAASTPETTNQTPESKVEDGQGENNDWFLHPKPEWNEFIYQFAIRRAIATDNAEGQENITRAYLESSDGRDSRNKESWEAFKEYQRLLLGKEGTLDRMQQLAESYPQNGRIQLYLGNAYEVYKDYEKAAASYRRAAENADDGNQTIANFGKAALALLRAGMKDESRAAVNKMKQEFVQTGEGEARMIEALREIATFEADSDMYFGLTERMLHLRPDAVDTRFDLAYKYSQENQDNLSFFHYLRIPHNQRHASAWNNLGVEYEHYGLQASSVNSYREAEMLGSTLAMSNVALKLIQTGFIEKAQEICDRALKMDNYDKTIGQRILSIKETPNEEEKKEAELVNKAHTYSEFYKAYGKALTVAEPANHVGLWQGPKCRLRIEIKGRDFIAEGNYEVALTNSLFEQAVGLLSVLPPMATRGPSQWLIRYIGEIVGHTVKASISEVEESKKSVSATGVLLGSPTSRKALLIIAESFAEIRVYEKDAQEDQRLYVLRRVDE